MLIVTTEKVPGMEVKEFKGFVKGGCIQSKYIDKDIVAGLRTIVCGEIKEYTEMMEEARKKAIERMADEAKSLGANTIVGMRLQTASVMMNVAEIVAYGTAVYVEKSQGLKKFNLFLFEKNN